MDLWLVVFTAAGWLATGSEATCYYPNGSPETRFAYDYQPCAGKNTTFAQCCIPGQDICTPNGLCTHLTNDWAGAYDYRAACANKDWSGCPKICPGVLPDSWLQVKQCATAEYCCNPDFDNGDCCRDGSPRFNLLDHNPDAPGSGNGTNPSNNDGGKGNSTDTGSPNNSTNGNGSGNDSTKDGNQNGGNSNDSKGSNMGATIGAAVGSAVGGVAVIGALVGVWWYLRRKRRNASKTPNGVPQSMSPGGYSDLKSPEPYIPVPVESDSRQVDRPVHELAG